MSAHPELFPQVRGRRGNGGRRADLAGLYVRSTWEANWARYLNWLKARGEVLSWEYEAETFEFPGVKRGGRFYTPDFRIRFATGVVEYHEVKGWMDPRSATKIKRMAKYHPNVTLLIVDADWYKDVARKLGPLIPGWEMTRNGHYARVG